MSYYKKVSGGKPLPHDPEAEQQAAEREAFKANNSTLQNNITAAGRQEIENRRRELTGAFADLRRMKLASKRSNFKAALDGYNRVYNRIQRLAVSIANTTGEAIDIPGYDPPSETDGAGTVQVKPGSVTEPTSYRETAGKGKSGKGLPSAAPVPGSAQANERGEWPT